MAVAIIHNEIKQLPTKGEKTLKKDFQVYIDLVLETIPASDS